MSDPETTAARPLAAPFTDGLIEGVLRYQQCAHCGGAQTLARYACQHCGERGALHWRDAAGAATVLGLFLILMQQPLLGSLQKVIR